MFDEDTINIINKESYAEYLHTKSIKNKILGMSNASRKQSEWQKHFAPVEEQDDTYLLAGIY